jgi:hypothetical protein
MMLGRQWKRWTKKEGNVSKKLETPPSLEAHKPLVVGSSPTGPMPFKKNDLRFVGACWIARDKRISVRWSDRPNRLKPRTTGRLGAFDQSAAYPCDPRTPVEPASLKTLDFDSGRERESGRRSRTEPAPIPPDREDR